MISEYIKPLKIGNVQLKNNIIAAPIAGFSDFAYRKICRDFGAGLTVTELTSAKGLFYQSKGTTELLYSIEDSPKAIQIFGAEPAYIERACEDERLAPFDIIDINMGCPMKKIVNNNEGSALMKNPSLIEEIVKSAVRGAKGKPVTVKMRLGYNMGEATVLECAQAAQDGGASMVAIHGRYREQMYAGEADHSYTAIVKEKLSIPVIANGDITNLPSLEKVAKETNADGFMIGRGMLGTPWIFAQLTDNHGEVNIKDVIYEHIALLKQLYNDIRISNVMKGQLCYYAKNIRHAKQVRMATSSIKDLDSLYGVVDEFFDVNIIY